MEFKIIESSSPRNFEFEINDALAAGWELFGVVMSRPKASGAGWYYAQALTRKQPPAPPASTPTFTFDLPPLPPGVHYFGALTMPTADGFAMPPVVRSPGW